MPLGDDKGDKTVWASEGLSDQSFGPAEADYLVPNVSERTNKENVELEYQ